LLVLFLLFGLVFFIILNRIPFTSSCGPIYGDKK
jgi:hypothetical protein